MSEDKSNTGVPRNRHYDNDDTGKHSRSTWDWVRQLPGFVWVIAGFMIYASFENVMTAYINEHGIVTQTTLDSTTKTVRDEITRNTENIKIIREDLAEVKPLVADTKSILITNTKLINDMVAYTQSIQSQLNKEKALNTPATIKGAESRVNRAHGQ